MTPQELFDLKWPGVQRCASYYAKLCRLSDADREDLAQEAGVYLWKRCLIPDAGPRDIDCRWVARHATSLAMRARARHAIVASQTPGPANDPDMAMGDPLDMLPAPARPHIRIVDAEATVTLTMQDVQLDQPETVHLWEHGLTSCQLARQRGVTHQAVHQRAIQLGGVFFPGVRRWRFPVEAARRTG